MFQPTTDELLPESAPIDPAQPSETRAPFEAIPAKAVVYALFDEVGHVLLLATVGDLRAALKRRLADPEPDAKSKRVPYGQLARSVRYRVVHSPFAANWVYLQAVRALFPERYSELITWRLAQWITVNPDQPFPRFERVTELRDAAVGRAYLGPIPERRAADKLVETVEDLFDLCRYHDILKLSPYGKACAYKEMGKCPAPCDGTVSMDHYRRQITAALDFLGGPADAIRRHVGYERFRKAREDDMTRAAAALEFERAGKIKQQLTRAAILEQEPYAHLDRSERFSYLALQPGQGKPYLEPFFIHGGTIVPGAQIQKKELAKGCATLYARCRELAAKSVRLPLGAEATEIVALVTHHLARGPDDAGIYLPAAYVTGPEQIAAAARELFDRRTPVKPMAEQSSDCNASSAETALDGKC